MKNKNEPLYVISLFDGISCGLQALKNLGYTNIIYFASEIDKYAQQVSESNHPEIVRLGDVSTVRIVNGKLMSENGEWDVERIDLLLAGSPCQGFSYAGKQLNFNDPRSKLYFEFIRIKGEIENSQRSNLNFLLENVRMKSEYEDVVTHDLKTWPVKINSKAFVPHNRLRYYWSSLLPTTVYGEEDITKKGEAVDVRNILEIGSYSGVWTWPRGWNKGGVNKVDVVPCITTSSWQHNFLVVDEYGNKRQFTPIEAERAQGLPDGYTSSISTNQRFKCLGNGWTVPVIEYILGKM